MTLYSCMIRLSDPIGKTILILRTSEVVGILGIGFRSEVVGCRKVSEWLEFRQEARLFRHISTSDNFLSESDTKDSVGIRRIRQDLMG